MGFCIRKKGNNVLANSGEMGIPDYRHTNLPHSTQKMGLHNYCRVPEGPGLQKTARPPGRDETRSVNPNKLLK